MKNVAKVGFFYNPQNVLLLERDIIRTQYGKTPTSATFQA